MTVSLWWIILKVIAEIVGVAGIVGLILKSSITGWIQLTFDRKLAEYRTELDKRLEDYKLGPASLLALFTHRAGVLSQVQLEAVRQMWARVVDLHLDLLDLTATIRVAAVENDGDRAQRLLAANRTTAVLLEKERPFLPSDLYELAAAYFATVRSTLHVFAEKAELPRLWQNPDRKELMREIKQLRAQIDANRAKIEGEHERLAEKIRELTSPTLPK
jgi:hypothetical protein